MCETICTAVEISDQTVALCSLQQPQELGVGLRLNANAMRISMPHLKEVKNTHRSR